MNTCTNTAPDSRYSFTITLRDKVAPLVGRFLLAFIFLGSALNKITPDGFTRTAGYMASKAMLFPELALVGAIALEALGGLMLAAGFMSRWGALMLLIFIIPATMIFHNMFVDPSQQIQFMKNTAIMGGLMMAIAHGAGPWSVDGYLCRRAKK